MNWKCFFHNKLKENTINNIYVKVQLKCRELKLSGQINEKLTSF